MGQITILLTRRRWNPISSGIRWAMPRSRFAWALSSHAIIRIGNLCYEATMLHGVRRVEPYVAMRGQQAVWEARFRVGSVTVVQDFLEAQLCTYEPKFYRWVPAWLRKILTPLLKIARNNYDFAGALGLSLAPGRDWSDPVRWFCYELAAGALKAGGRTEFKNLSHVGETALMAINP